MDWIKNNSWWLGLLLNLIGILISILITFLPSDSFVQLVGVVINNPFGTIVIITLCFLYYRLWRLECLTKEKRQ